MILLGLITPAFSFAHDATEHEGQFCKAVASAEVNVSADANLVVIYPAEGEVIRSKDFTLQLSPQGDVEAAGLDHLHWQIDQGFNHTAADLSGVIDVTGIEDGEHTLTTYMATVDHVPINGKKIINFTVYSSGTSMIAPSNGETLQSNDVTVSYQLWGEPAVATFVKVQLDDSAPVADWQGDGQLEFTGLKDGAHRVRVWRSDYGDEEVGQVAEVEFVVTSSLSPQNATLAKGNFSKAQKSDTKAKRKKQWKNLREVLEEMAAGGTQHPDIPALNNENVMTAINYARKIQNLVAKDKLSSKEKKTLQSTQNKLKRLLDSMLS